MAQKHTNKDIIENNHPHLVEVIEYPWEETIDVTVNKNGLAVPAVVLQDKKVFIHSKFDPVKEAERTVSGIDPSEFDLVLVFGFGFAYHIEVLLDKMSPQGVLVAVEKNPAMVAAASASRDMSRILNDPRLVILVDPGEDDFSRFLKGKSSKKVSFVNHRGSYQLDPQYYTSLNGIARSYLSTKEVNIATLAKFEKVWSSNIARNIVRFISSPGVDIFYGKFTGMPVVVVAAGPSLNASLDFIKKSADRAIIVAVDTAYRVLVHAGIEPHFCVAVDPQVINARYFEGAAETRTVLITDPTVHPSVFRLFPGRVAITGVAFDMMKWIEKIAGVKGDISHGGSVSTNAYDFAVRSGASPVVLVGQDLAFTGGYAHARGSYLDEQVHVRTDRVNTAEMFNRRQLTALPRIMVKGINGGEVHTNQKMTIFLSWFEKRNDPTLINASIDGAFMPGVKHQRAETLIFKQTSQNIFSQLDKLYSDSLHFKDSEAVKKSLLDKLSRMEADIAALVPVLERAVGFSENLIKVMKESRKDQGKMDYILKKLSETDTFIESKTEIKDFISIAIQRVIHTITEGYAIDENDSNLQNDELVAKRSLFMYQGLLEGARFNAKIIHNMSLLLKSLSA